MKAIQRVSMLIMLLLPASCAKDDPAPVAKLEDGFYAVKARTGSPVYSLRDKEGTYEMSFFGTRDGAGTVTDINSATLTRTGKKDSVFSFLFDSQQRVKAMFVSVRGAKQPYLIKFSYATNFINVTAYKLDWTTGAVFGKESALLNAPDLSLKKIVGGRLAVLPGPNIARLSLHGSIFVIGILAVTEGLIVGATAVTLGPAIAVMGGAILIAKGLKGFENELKKHNINSFGDFITSLTGSRIPSATPEEIDLPDPLPDPEKEAAALYSSNPKIDWCEHTVTFNYPLWLYFISGNKVVHKGALDPSVTCCVKDVYITIQKPVKFPSCSGPSSTIVLGTRSFQLKPGASISYNYNYSTAICETQATYSETIQFECPE